MSRDGAVRRTIMSPRGRSGAPGTRGRTSSSSASGRQGSPQRMITSPREPKQRQEDEEKERVDSLASVRFIYVGGKELNDVGDLLHCRSCEFAWLPGNMVSSIASLESLANIRLLDLSYNCISFLPNETFWSGLRHLQHAMFHGNRISKAASYSGLSGLPSLRILTMSVNPVAATPYYRSLTISLCPWLLALDGLVVSDDDLLPPTDPLHALVASHRASRDYTMPPVWRVDENSDYTHHALAHLHQMISAHRLRSCASPSLLLQRVFRGHLGRRLHRRYRSIVHPAAHKIQKWLLRCFARRQGGILSTLKEASNSSNADLARVIDSLPSIEAPPDPRFDHSVYFFPHDAARVMALADGMQSMFSPGEGPAVSMSDFLCVARSAAGSTTPFTRGAVMRRMHAFRAGQDLCRLLRIKGRPTVLQVVSFSIVGRHGHKVTSKEKVAFWTSQKHGLSGEDALRGSRNRLVQVSMGSAASARLLLRAVEAVSKGGKPLRYFLPEVACKLASICSLQATVRSHMQRRLIVPPLGTALMAVRAIRCIQRWWRWRLLNLRIGVLRDIKARLQEGVGKGEQGARLYLIGRGMGAKLHAASRRGGIMRESRAKFGYDSEGRAVVERGGDDGVGGGRGPVPKWLGWDIKVTDGACERSGVDSTGHPDLHSLVEHQVTRLQVNTSMGRLGSGRIPRRQLTGNGSILELTFESVEEAMSRMVLLMVHTWGPARRGQVRLYTAPEARMMMSALLIQSWYRGSKARQWFQPMSSFLHRHLDTSIFAEKSSAWAAKGRRPSNLAYRAPAPRGPTATDPSMQVDVSYSQYLDGTDGGADGEEGVVEANRATQVSHVLRIPAVGKERENGEGDEEHEGGSARGLVPATGRSQPEDRDRGRETERDGADAFDGADDGKGVHWGAIHHQEDQIGTHDLLYLQAQRLRVAGVRPAVEDAEHRAETVLRYGSDMAYACKAELEAQDGYTREVDKIRLEEQKRKNRVQRDTFALSNALRNVVPGFSVRGLQKEGKYVSEMREVQSVARLRMRAQQQRDAHAMAMKDAADSRRAEATRSKALRAAKKEEAEEQMLRERARTAPSHIRPGTANDAVRAVKERVNFSQAFQCTTNMIGYHVHRAEMERMHSAEQRLASVRVQIAKTRRVQGQVETREEMQHVAASRQYTGRADKVVRLVSARRKRLPSAKAPSVSPSPTVFTTRMAMDYPVVKGGDLRPREISNSPGAMPWGDTPPPLRVSRSAPVGASRPKLGVKPGVGGVARG